LSRRRCRTCPADLPCRPIGEDHRCRVWCPARIRVAVVRPQINGSLRSVGLCRVGSGQPFIEGFEQRFAAGGIAGGAEQLGRLVVERFVVGSRVMAACSRARASVCLRGGRACCRRRLWSAGSAHGPAAATDSPLYWPASPMQVRGVGRGNVLLLLVPISPCKPRESGPGAVSGFAATCRRQNYKTVLTVLLERTVWQVAGSTRETSRIDPFESTSSMEARTLSSPYGDRDEGVAQCCVQRRTHACPPWPS
jgi:hypothetical protein